MQHPAVTSGYEAGVLPPALAPGARLGRYLLLEEVGTGGMGVVMAAYDHELDRKIALKLLRPDVSRSGEARMRREAQSLAQLQHPAVVTVFEVGKHQGQLYIAMEYIEGQTLDKWAAQHPGQWRKILPVALRAGRGLAAAHAAGLVHRDVKPSNILVGKDGRVCVADFGIATATGRNTDSKRSGPRLSAADADPEDTAEISASESLAVVSSSVQLDGMHFTEAGAVVGTPAYMAPEQHRGEAVDARSDQFAFCVALYRVLYGGSPFEGDDLDGLRRSVIEGRIKPPPRGTRVPVALRRVLLRGLESDPARRWPSMTALLDALEHTLGRRRRWVVATSAVGALGLAGIVAAVVADSEPAPAVGCLAADERLAGVWDAERAAQLRDAFMATELPFAMDTWARTRDRLDRHAQAWSDRYQAICTAMGARSSLALDLEMACLGRRREELAALVELLLAADPATVPKATQAAAELEPVGSCRAVGQEAAAMSEPDPAQVEEVDEIRLMLARAEAAYKAGALAVGIDHAERARARAQALGYGPVEVEALYRLGSLQALAGRLDEAQENLGEAALRAVEVRHDRVAAQAATMQAFVVGYQQERHEDGLVWLRHATAALERLGPDPLLEAELRSTRAAILNGQGRYKEALPEFRAALAQREQELDAGHPLVASSYNNLGSVLTQLGRYDEALEAMDRALNIWRDSYGPQHPVVATALNGMGAVLERVGRYDDARARFEAALALREAIFGPDHVNVAITLDNLGSVLTRLGRYDEARAASQRALELRERSLGPRHPHCASSLVNLGLVAERQGRLDEAIRDHRRAIEIWEEALGPDHPYLGFPLTSLGRIEAQRGDPDAAVALLERALQIRQTVGEPHEQAETELALAQVLWPRDPARARQLAQRAVIGLEGTPHASGELHRDIEAWLRAHPQPT
ncbi:MAG: serine/threonine protein kinase [Myxococcales bacterium]|nr:serine/threonine protein kinase [Myxococcales bacterium]